MPDRPGAVALWGADARVLSVARRWLEAGIDVTLIEPDVHDAVRARAMLGRAGLGLQVTTPDNGLPRARVLLTCLPDPPEMPGALVVAVGADAAPSVTFHATTGAPALAEIVVDDEGLRGTLLELIAAAGLDGIETRGVGVLLAEALRRAADDCLAEGATPVEVDEALTGAGFAIGPYELEDLTGLDRGHAARVARGGFHKGLAEHAAAEGRLGKSAGVGWYRYPGGGGAVEDPLVEDLIRLEAHLARLPQDGIRADEIVKRIVGALADAAASAVTGGRATPAAVDRIAEAGFGVPAGLLRATPSRTSAGARG